MDIQTETGNADLALKKENKILINLIKVFTVGYIVFAIINSVLVFRQLIKSLAGINVFSFPLFLFALTILFVIFGLLYLFFYLALNKAEKGKNLQAIIYLLIGITVSLLLILY